jgi:hypothetical protein
LSSFAKHCFEPLLSSLGEFTPAKPVSAEVREIDVYFFSLRLTSRRARASPHEIWACASKLYEVHNDIIRKAKRAKERPPAPEQRSSHPPSLMLSKKALEPFKMLIGRRGSSLRPKIGTPASLSFTSCPKLPIPCGFDSLAAVTFKLRLSPN